MEFGNPEGLKHAKDYKYSPSLLGKVLDKVPFLGGYRDYKRALDYNTNVHKRPNSYSGADIYSSSSRIQNEINDETMKDVYNNQSLVQYSPKNFGYRNIKEVDDKTLINQYIKGTGAGHTVEEDDELKYSVDPFNIAKFERGKSFFGIPYGYSGSVKSNPGIDAYIDPEYFKNQITDGRMQVY